MENRLKTETAKLSLISAHSSATAVTHQHDLTTIEDIAASLPAILQTTLELNDLIILFHKEISKVLEYGSLHFQHQDIHCDISTAKRNHHSCNYRLEMDGAWLGELTLTRRSKFTEKDTLVVEDLLCKLIYPLRNCLLFRQAKDPALQDKLTGLNNRGAFEASLKREIDLAQRQHAPMSLVVLDIDNFKTVNDAHGHSGGDLALAALAKSLTNSMRTSDIAFRYGGEEFTLILSNTDSESACLVAERIRIAVSQLSCNDGKRNFGFTISLGVAQLERGEKSAALFDRADQALYQAKKAGRNQTVSAENLINKN